MYLFFIKQTNNPLAILYSTFDVRFHKCTFQCIRIFILNTLMNYQKYYIRFYGINVDVRHEM